MIGTVAREFQTARPQIGQKERNNSMKIVTLTDEQASTLEVYLLITTKYRQGEIEACESLSRELDENGSSRFPKNER